MNSSIGVRLALAFLLAAMLPAQVLSQGLGGDLLNEAPFYRVPEGMTLEEYRDANRRIGVGLLLSAIPFPGSLHFYAGERRAGWKHVGVAAAGLTSIVIGAVLIEDREPISFKKSDFQVVEIIGESGERKRKRYEKIPIEVAGPDTTFRLRELGRERDLNGGHVFIILGAALIIGDIIHDWYAGIRIIERKRDTARYKYGKQIRWSMSFSPELDIQHKHVGVRLALGF